MNEQQRSHVHLLGIGGTGMSSLALLLQRDGQDVSGSDARASEVTTMLERSGIPVSVAGSAGLPPGVGRLVLSSAIPAGDPDLLEAQRRGIEIVHRSDELSRLFNRVHGIAIAGTHGKTTTSALLTHILIACGENPSAMIGGCLVGYGTNAFLGDGPFVTEADESDGSLLAYKPRHAVVTSVDDDVNVTAAAYVECGYHREKVQEAVDNLFLQFAANTSDGLWVCHEHARASSLLGRLEGTRTYGVDGTCTLRAEAIERGPLHTLVEVYLRGRSLGLLRVPMPGHHNVLNSLAAVGVALDLGLDFRDVAHAVAMFRGVQRRFEMIGRKNGCLCVDDYAHNPQKVAAALQAGMQAGRGRLVALFQPHRYTRMRLLDEAFLPALDGADQIILTDVYASGEEPNGFSIESFAQSLRERSPSGSIHWAPGREEVLKTLDRITIEGDLVLSLGAGSCGQWLREWVESPLTEASPDEQAA